MRRSTLKQLFAWALVDHNGKLALFDGRCPIYWNRSVANRERAERAEHGEEYTVDRITVLPVHR